MIIIQLLRFDNDGLPMKSLKHKPTDQFHKNWETIWNKSSKCVIISVVH